MTFKKRLSLFIFTCMLISISNADNSFIGSINPIPQNLQQKMIGNTWHEGCPVPISDLSLLTMSYWGFDNKPHMGEMIIHHQLATEVLDIFRELYNTHFPIEKMIIPENFIGNKKFSNSIEFLLTLVNANDTYGFFCRIDTQTNNKPSPHSFGIAMDLNPFYNPAIVANPKKNPAISAKRQVGIQYLNRNLNHIGMIKENDGAFKIFLNHGWEWGGFFSEGVDYMHFQKVISTYYKVNHLDYVLPTERISNIGEKN